MIAIIDYKAGNLTSVKLAFDSIGAASRITSDSGQIRAAERVVFPGDGAALSAMQHLDELNLKKLIPEIVADGVPFLGICLGTQIIFDSSSENSGVDCLGILSGTVDKFETDNSEYKIPQMGWNSVKFNVAHPLFTEIENDSEFYFIHSYYPAPEDSDEILGITEYATIEFASIVGRKNLIATQFHPERSGNTGLKLIENFSKWNGEC